MAHAAIYLHGFASSAASAKASFFRVRLAQHGVTLHCPDFNQPDFATLTLTRMMDRLDQEMTMFGENPVALIGSSLGGALAVLAAARFGARVDRLVLLAPAVMFAKEGHHLLGTERLDEWRRLGRLPFFHYADGADRMLNYTFYEDSVQHHPFDAVFAQPTLIFQGVQDASVDFRTVDAFARSRPNTSLVLLEDDHQLLASLPLVWESSARFLGVA